MNRPEILKGIYPSEKLRQMGGASPVNMTAGEVADWLDYTEALEARNALLGAAAEAGQHWQTAYEKVTELAQVGQVGTEYATAFHQVNYARLELFDALAACEVEP